MDGYAFVLIQPIIRIATLNKGGPPIQYQFSGANRRHWLSKAIYVKLDDLIFSNDARA